MTMLVLVPFVVLLLVAAGWDLASYTIPNFISAATLVAFALFALSAGLTLGALEGHLLAGMIGLICAFLLFAPVISAAAMPSCLPASRCGSACTISVNMLWLRRCLAAH